MSGDGRLVVKSFPPELHRQLRVQAAADGQEMREIVIEAVSAELGRRVARAELAARARAANPPRGEDR